MSEFLEKQNNRKNAIGVESSPNRFVILKMVCVTTYEIQNFAVNLSISLANPSTYSSGTFSRQIKPRRISYAIRSLKTGLVFEICWF